MLIKHNNYSEPPKSETLLPEQTFYNDCVYYTRTKWAAAQYPAKLEWADSKDNSDW